jgi:hypothetical protein
MKQNVAVWRTIYMQLYIQEKITLEWPIHCLKSESPDFQLSIGKTTIGLEHSTITSSKYMQFRSEHIRNPKEETIWTDTFRIGGAPIDEINLGWVGDGVEKEWVLLAISRIVDKYDKLNKNHFCKFDRNELILNTISYLPALDIIRAIPMLGVSVDAELAKKEYSYSYDSISLIYGSLTFPNALSISKN